MKVPIMVCGYRIYCNTTTGDYHNMDGSYFLKSLPMVEWKRCADIVQAFVARRQQIVVRVPSQIIKQIGERI